ncbi:MAG: helix-turn-helix transcriptional regulator [Pyrinomonadaceae bacterium]|nr:helix-turn-helix transcriptional regulator [Pyrinomonadaceae bacterium]
MPDKKLLNQFGTRIRELRLAKGLSQEQLAERTGFHRTYIGMVERGERNLSLSNIATLARSFDLSISELLDFGGGR